MINVFIDSYWKILVGIFRLDNMDYSKKDTLSIAVEWTWLKILGTLLIFYWMMSTEIATDIIQATPTEAYWGAGADCRVHVASASACVLKLFSSVL